METKIVIVNTNCFNNAVFIVNKNMIGFNLVCIIVVTKNWRNIVIVVTSYLTRLMKLVFTLDEPVEIILMYGTESQCARRIAATFEKIS